MTTVIWNPFDLAFWAQHGHDVYVNVLASAPFFIFDVAILTLLLPFAIELLNDIRSRKLRRDALSGVFQLIIAALGRLESAIRRDIELAKTHDREIFTTRNIIECNTESKFEIEQQLPIFMAMLDPESNRAVYDASREFRVYMREHETADNVYEWDKPQTLISMPEKLKSVYDRFLKLGNPQDNYGNLVVHVYFQRVRDAHIELSKIYASTRKRVKSQQVDANVR